MNLTKSLLPQLGRVLVTGSDGFIGGHLVARLQSAGADLFEIRNRQDCDLRDFEAVRVRFQEINPDIVIHLAASPDVRQQARNYYQLFHNTISCTLSVLNAISSCNVRLLVHIGSYKQYGGIPLPFREIDAVNLTGAYGLAKNVTEQLCRHSENASLKTVCLRLGPVFGPRQTRSYLIPHTICSILENRHEALMAADMPWDPVYIDDVVEAIYLSIIQPKVWGRIVNISGGISYTPREIMRCIAELMNQKIEPGQYKKKNDECLMPCLGDISLAEHLLGWKPQTSLREGLRLTIEHFYTVY